MRPQPEASRGAFRTVDRRRLQIGAMADERITDGVRLGSGKRAYGIDEAAAREQGVGRRGRDADLKLRESRELGSLRTPEQFRASASRADP